MAQTVSLFVTIETLQCANCGLPFGITKEYMSCRRDDHGGFYCPNGHVNYYPQASEAEVLRKKLSDEQARHANTQLELMAAQKSKQRLEKRIKNGACPCCNKQFVQLTRHMKSKHPDYQENK